MIRSATALVLLVLADTGLAKTDSEKPSDLFYGEGLYYAYQGGYFDAISRLDTELGQYYGLDEPELNSLYFYIDHAEFSVGDFELYYRMHHRAGRAMKSVIEADVDERIRNEAIYRLSKLFHHKNQSTEALYAIGGLKGDIPEKIKDDLELLKGQIYIANGRYQDAVNVLSAIESSAAGFAAYNLAIALIGSGDKAKGLMQLDKVGQINSSDQAVLAIKDKANLVLGYQLMENKQPEQAKKYFERITLEGPFSDRALLGSGWADTASGLYKRALVPWSILAKRNITDLSVQEVLLSLPFAYSKLEAHGTAAILYGEALAAYGQELDKLDSSIGSILEGKFLRAVVRDEFKYDKNWLINLRSLPNAPETFYLKELLASNDFQESLKNYFDLEELDRKIASWDGYLDAYTDIIKQREKYYTPLLPAIQEQFRLLDSRMKLRLVQRQKIVERLDKMLISPRPDYLATSNEWIALNKIGVLETTLDRSNLADKAELKSRIKRLKGVIDWNIKMEYQQRFTEARENIHKLDESIDNLNEQYRSFVRARQAATQSYIGYDDSIRQLKNRIVMADEKIKLLKTRQGNMLETMAISELKNRRKRIEELQIKARFAMAESYDKAVKSQQKTVPENTPSAKQSPAEAPEQSLEQAAKGDRQ